MYENLISVIDAATQLGTRKQQVFKLIKRLGLSSTKHRNSSHKKQVIAYITKDDLDLIIRHMATGKSEKEEGGETSSTFQVNRGVFYLIQLEPEHDPDRFKVGFASNLPKRLRAHRCSAPFSTVVATWPCLLLWEKTAIDCVTPSCKKIHTEVFRTDDIAEVKTRCEQFFSLMPDVE